MTQQLVRDLAQPEAPRRAGPGGLRLLATFAGLLALAVVLAGAHVTQGTSGIGAGDLLDLATGGGAEPARDVLVGSRLPRLGAVVLVGIALGMAGAVLQSVARNALASPDTLAVDAGAYLAIVAAAALNLTLPVVPRGLLALTGGLLAAGLVLALSAGGGTAPTRLVLAGTAVALALDSVAYLLLLLFEQGTVGLYAFSNGTLVQADLEAVQQMTPVVLLAGGACLALGGRLDVLSLGDDTARSLGLDVRRTRTVAVLLAVTLTAAAVSVAGPIGFVGLAAPVLVRLLVPLVPGAARHRALVPLAGLVGLLVVLGSDVLLRACLGAQTGVSIPAGVVTTAFGAVLLVVVARQYSDSTPARQTPGASTAVPPSALRFRLLLLLLTALTAVALVVGMLGGDRWLLLGDITAWAQGESGRALTFVLDARFPRVLAALLAGAALAVAGTAVQGVCRNPLAEPSLLGISSGAGVGAVLLLVVTPTVGVWTLSGVATAGALLTFALVYALAWRDGGLSSDRLVLIGIAVSSIGASATVFIIVLEAPYETGLALTWLSGSTYARTLGSVVPVALALVVLTPLLMAGCRRLDVMALDDDLPRVLGLRLERTRLAVLSASAVLTAAAVSAVGVVGFVGLVAPHAARALVGGRHARVVPVAALLGALLVSVADTLGRSVIAPAQVPAGLVTAMLGTPYFVYLLRRTRPRAA